MVVKHQPHEIEPRTPHLTEQQVEHHPEPRRAPNHRIANETRLKSEIEPERQTPLNCKYTTPSRIEPYKSALSPNISLNRKVETPFETKSPQATIPPNCNVYINQIPRGGKTTHPRQIAMYAIHAPSNPKPLLIER